MSDGNGADVLDLTAVAAAHPARRIEINPSAMLAHGMGLGEVLDVAAAVGVPSRDLGRHLREGSDLALRIGIAVAWVIARRDDPAVTIEDANRWQIVFPEAPPPDPPEPAPGGPMPSS